MFILRDWIKTDEKEKDAEWANRIITNIRMYMQPLVNLEHARKGMNYWLGTQDMSPIKNLFQNPDRLNIDNQPIAGGYKKVLDAQGRPIPQNEVSLQPEMVGVDFISLPIMEKIRNMLIAEMKKMGVIVDAKCDDPTSVVARKKDESLIKNKKAIEGMLSYIYTSIGQAPVSLNQHEERFGERHDNGNTQDFENMSLDGQNPADVFFFMQNFHKLAWEIAAQMPIDYVMKFNQAEDIFIENWTNDLGSKKAIAAQVSVSQLNGAIQYNYLTPETTYIYGGGRRKDYNDANAKAYQQTITIKELLDRVGDSFDFENEIDLLFRAIYTASNGSVDITGIHPDTRGGYYFSSRNTTANYSYDSFMSFKVNFGYVEFVSQNDTDYEKKVKPKKGKKAKAIVEDNQPDNGKRYQEKSRYETPTYKAYYLVINAIEQRLFDFGKVTYQQIEGYNDANVNFTILTYKEIGESIALNCAPFIDLMNECWYKCKFEIRKAKAAGMDFNYTSLVSIAENIYADSTLSMADKVQKVISYLDSSANSVWDYPVIDGRIVPLSSNQINIPKPNGLTDGIMKWWEMMLTTEQKMLSFIGLDAPLRQGNPGQSRDSMNNQFKALEYSQNNTYYIPDTITYMFQQLASRTMLHVTDIIQFNDVDTLAYKFLADAVGEETLASISQLGKKAMHRYGIFVESMNQSPERAKLQARIDFALQKGAITNAQVMLIESIKSPKKAMLTLAYFEQRNIAIAQKNAMEQQKAAADQAMQIEKMKQDTVMLAGNLEIEKQKISSDALIQAHLITQQGGLDKAAMKHSVDTEQIYQQAHANILEKQAELNNTGKTTPPPPQLPPAQVGGPSPQPERTPSAISQQLEETQPGPTNV